MSCLRSPVQSRILYTACQLGEPEFYIRPGDFLAFRLSSDDGERVTNSTAISISPNLQDFNRHGSRPEPVVYED